MTLPNLIVVSGICIALIAIIRMMYQEYKNNRRNRL